MNPPRKNRLAGSASPYLLMHATNPVDWYPWGDEAFLEARKRDCFVFLSIGYAACHWCHVMEQECFSDPEVASLLNTYSIPVKVDREERPDIDQLYMTAIQLMTGSGGWPMSIFLTPDRKPFFAATYIPKFSRQGATGMMDIIPYLADIWKNRRHEVYSTGSNVIQAVATVSEPPSGSLFEKNVHDAYTHLAAEYDPRYGGFSASPKFPSVPQLLFLLRYFHRYSEITALKMAEHTLRQMAVGGIRDHLDGGFHRYATDQAWKLPHFEKMLYDQALLATAYCEGYRISPDPLFEITAKELLDFVCTTLTDENGGFWSSIDADSPGGEGAYYLWTMDEVEQVLQKEDCTRFCTIYGFTDHGNVSGHGLSRGNNVLYPGRDPLTVVQELDVSNPSEWLDSVRMKLKKAREKRNPPAVDDKILTDWNGLVISALVLGYHTFGCYRYYTTAVRAATCILEHLMQPDGRLSHHWHQKGTGLQSMSSDYIFFALALLDLFQADGNVKWMNAVTQLNHQLDIRFWDEKNGGYFTSGADASDLPVRLKDLTDSALPSINGMAALLMQRLARITENQDDADRYYQIIRMVGGGQSYGAMLSFFCACLERHDGFLMLAFFPDKSEEISEVLREVRSQYLPGSMIIPVFDPKTVSPIIPGILTYPDSPALIICGKGQCYPPITTRDEYLLWRSERSKQKGIKET